MTMKLSYIHGNYIDSEKANVVRAVDMSQAFAQCGVDVTLIMGAARKKSDAPMSLLGGYLGQQPAFKIVTYKKYTIARRLEIFGNFFGVRALLRTYKADLCVVADPLILRLCLDAGFPAVFEAHQSELHNNQWFSKFWEKDVLSNAKNPKLLRFVTISQALAEIWRIKGVPENKIIRAHLGFSQHAFEAVKVQSEARKMIGLPTKGKIVVYAGNLQPDRGIERIIELAKKFSQVLFVVVGGPENRKQYFQDLSCQASINNITWVGHVPHATVPNYLYAADILLMLWTWDVPTINVCSPLKLFEYMAAERIIVGEAFPTITEVLDEKTAYLAKPGSFDDLCEKLSQALIQDYPSKMAIKARQLAIQEYTWNSRAQKILDSVKGLL
jgi:glycosyltransferase involved in cell wall biosynthesis